MRLTVLETQTQLGAPHRLNEARLHRQMELASILLPKCPFKLRSPQTLERGRSPPPGQEFLIQESPKLALLLQPRLSLSGEAKGLGERPEAST